MPALELRIWSYGERRFSPNQRPEGKAVCGPSAPVSPGTSSFPTARHQAEAEEKLKLQYFGHLYEVDSLEKTLMLGGIGGRRRRG